MHCIHIVFRFYSRFSRIRFEIFSYMYLSLYFYLLCTHSLIHVQAQGSGGAPHINYKGFKRGKREEPAVVDENGKLAKGWAATGRSRTTLKCPSCNSLCTAAHNLGEPLAHGPGEMKEFFQKGKGLTMKQMEQHVQTHSAKTRETRDQTGSKGGYLPLGVYETAGWDGAWIKRNCQDYYDQDGCRFYCQDVIERQFLDMKSHVTGETLDKKAKAKAASKPAGPKKAAMPKIDTDVATWTDGQHPIFLVRCTL